MACYTSLLTKRAEFIKRLPQIASTGRQQGFRREIDRLPVTSILGLENSSRKYSLNHHRPAVSVVLSSTDTQHSRLKNVQKKKECILEQSTDLLPRRTCESRRFSTLQRPMDFPHSISRRLLGNNVCLLQYRNNITLDLPLQTLVRFVHVNRDSDSNLPDDRGARSISTSPVVQEPTKVKARGDDEKSKVEETVEALRKKREEEELHIYHPPQLASKSLPVTPAPKKTLIEKVKDGFWHYVQGFKLFFLEIQISSKLLWRVLNGHSLTRRERKIFLRTVADLFKMIPLLVFLIVPFMEFALPVVIKLFPNLLPSTFEDKTKKDEARLKQLRVKISMAKFMQDTVEEMAVQARKKKAQQTVVEFANFFERIRSKGLPPSNEEILKFSKLFEDEITLDNMGYPMLSALCKMLNLQSVGTDNYLRFQLRMKLRQLRADDLMIKKEGIDSLDVQELQVAVMARGMRAIGVPEVRLKSQLKQWLELHLDEEVPASLLLMSRAFFIPETIVPVKQLKETLSGLPEPMVDEAEIKLAETSGEQVDRQTKIDVLMRERQLMAAEREQEEIEALELKKKTEAIAQAEAAKKEMLEDKAPDVEEKHEYSKEQLLSIQEALPLDMDREELEQIKEDREEFNEELKDLKAIDEDREFKESVASKRLGRRVDMMINRLENSLQSLEKELDKLPNDTIIDADRDGIITTEELSKAIKKLHSFPNEDKCRRISELLDEDKDGNVDLDSLHKIIATLAREDVKLTSKQIEEIILLVKREELIEEERLRKESLLKAGKEASSSSDKK